MPFSEDVPLEDREDCQAGVAAERERILKIADGIGLAARRLRSGYGHMHPGINNYAQCFEHESDRLREGK